MKFNNECEHCIASKAGDPGHPTIASHWESCPACYYPFTEEAADDHLSHSYNTRSEMLRETTPYSFESAVYNAN